MFELDLQDDGLARLRLNRPESRNAIPMDQWDALAAQCETASRSGARLLLVQGARAAFCAGADLREFESLDGDVAGAAAFRHAMRRGIEALAAVPLATIAVVEGPCYGAGVALALACDIRLAGPDALFAITPARMGISFPQEDVARLVRQVGAGQASRLLFGGGSIDRAAAFAIGLTDGGLDELEALSGRILENDGESIASLKRGIRLAGEGRTNDPQQDRVFDTLLASEELAHRLAARRRR